MAASAIRFGPGATREVGMDFANMRSGGVKKVLVLTDATVWRLPVMQTVREALECENVEFEVFDKCRVEPKDYS